MPSLLSPLRIALVPLIAGVLALTGCGSSHSSSSSTPATAPSPASTAPSPASTSTSPRTSQGKSSTTSGGTSSTGSGTPSTGSGTPSTGSPAPANAGPLCPNGETACVSQNPGAPISGPKTLSTNLIRLLTRSNPKLKQVQLACARSSSYPVICQLTGVDTTRGKAIKVTGQLTVAGVDTQTHTYAYSALYAPVSGH